ncbi:MAG: hypothetical protein ACKVVP_01630 [Chloroflexota bacterium]
MHRWRSPCYTVLLALAIALSACGSAPEPPKRPKPAHNDNEHEESDALQGHGLKTLASLGSPLIHKGDAPHKVVEILLATETEARSIPSARLPLANLRSPLILSTDAPHDHPPVLLVIEGGVLPKFEVAGAQTNSVRGSATSAPRVPSPTPGPIDVGIAGTVIRVDGRVIVVKTDNGERSINVPVSTRVFQDVEGSAADLATGEIASVVKRPDGGVRSVHLYPRGMPSPAPGMEPLSGADQGLVMLTGVISGLHPGSLVMTADGQTFPLTLTPGARVVKAASAAMPELTAGRRVNVKAVRQPSGSTTAVAIHLADSLPTSPNASTAQTAVASPAPSPAAR